MKKNLKFKKQKRGSYFSSTLSRGIALVTNIVFLLTTVMGTPSLYAQTISAGVSGELQGVTQEAFFARIPLTLGRVQEFQLAEGSSKSPFVIHIQDAHANPEAQDSIRQLLDLFYSERGELAVAVEGAKGNIHPEYLNLFSEYPKINEFIVKELAKKGELSGAELFAWGKYKESAEKISIAGAEDGALYLENLNVYQSLLFRQDEVESLLAKWRKNLELAKSHIFSPGLRKFIQERERRKHGNYGAGDWSGNAVDSPQLAVYLRYLSNEAADILDIDLNDRFEQVRFPNLVRVLVLDQIQGVLNQSAAKREKKQILETLKKKVRSTEHRRTLEQFENLDNALNPRQIMEGILNIADSYRVSLDEYKEFWKSATLTVLRSEVKSFALFDEMARLEEWLIDRLVTSNAERELVNILKDALRFEDLVKLKMTREDFLTFAARKNEIYDLIRDGRVKSLMREAGAKKETERVTLDSRTANALIEFGDMGFRFYQGAEKRDQVILENAIQAGSEGQPVVLIGGGFHTLGFTEQLREQGIGYAVVQPKFRSVDKSREFYHRLMRAENSDVSAYFGKPYLTTQEGALFKSILESGVPAIWDQYQVPHSKIGEIVEKAINEHPVLSKRLMAQSEVDGAGSAINLTFLDRDGAFIESIKAGEFENVSLNPNALAKEALLGELAVAQPGGLAAVTATPRLATRIQIGPVIGTVVQAVQGFLRQGTTAGLQPALGVRSETRLSPEQMEAVERAVEGFELTPSNRQYLIQMVKQALFPEDYQKSLKIILDRENPAPDANFLLGAQLTEEERQTLLGAFEYSMLRLDPKNAEAAKNASVTIYSLDGGLGESLDRKAFKEDLVRRGLLDEKAVERDDKKRIKLGAKGMDLGFFVEIRGQELFISVAEAKLLQVLNLQAEGKFHSLALQPIVNQDSLPSYAYLFDQTIYLYDRLDDSIPASDKRTYREVLEENGIAINEPFMQQDIPYLTADATLPVAQTNVKTEEDDIKLGQPGGHGQLGFEFFFEPEKWKPREDGKPQIRYFTNGDNLNSSRVDEHVVGKMLNQRLPIMKATTVATRIDTKGGKDGVKAVTVDGRTIYVPAQMEIADAKSKAVKQEKEFTLAGQADGAEIFGAQSVGTQPFNTNIFPIYEDVLYPLLADLKSVLGDEAYYEMISATRIDKAAKEIDGQTYLPVDGAIGTVIHNLNEFIMLAQDPNILKVLDKHKILPDEKGVRRILYFTNLSLPFRSDFFTPEKKTNDAYMQAFSDYFRLNTTRWILEETQDGLVPPEINLDDVAAYKELQNLVEDFGVNASIARLDKLVIKGERVDLRDATLSGDVEITNESGARVDLRANPYRSQLEAAGFLRDGVLQLENVRIHIQQDESMQLKPLVRSETRKAPKLGGTRPDLEELYRQQVEAATPEHVKRNRLLEPDNIEQIALSPEEIVVTIKREHLQPFDAENNPEGLGLWEWLEDYEKEAQIATAGIRLTQNINNPWSTLNRISEVGIALATLGKGLALNEKYPDADLVKFMGGEVRYNTKHYQDLVSRINASLGIRTVLPAGQETIPIWMASFLIFVHDMVGGEHGTSSHANSSFFATKDLNNEGSQFLPEESEKFVSNIRKIFETAEREGAYQFTIAPRDHELIDEDFMGEIEDGVNLYVQYLKNGVATDVNLQRIRGVKQKLIIDNVGGSMARTMPRIFNKLGIQDAFEWFHVEEDPFFHGIGKDLIDGEVRDFTQDTTIINRDKKTGEVVSIPVMERMGYDELLNDKPVGTTLLMTDPDGDRLVTAQIEENTAERIEFLRRVGVDYLILDDSRIVALYTPNQSFFMTLVYHANSLKEAGLWEDHPRFIIMTTASSAAWREWAEKNGVNVLNVPVGFKEIAAMMKKVEEQIRVSPDQPVVVKDIFGREVNLGVQPRLLLAAEESGGMIIGPEELIESRAGRKAIAMREKSAGEALVIQAALAAHLESQGKTWSEYLNEIFEENDLKAKYDVRSDTVYYNQNNPDAVALKNEKAAGEKKRTQNYVFYLSLALAYRDGAVRKDQVIQILNDTFSDDNLDFSDLDEIAFVGDGVYLQFPTKVLEIRPSGTDAKSKSYAMGDDKTSLALFAMALGGLSGERTPLHLEIVPDSFYEDAESIAWESYQEYYREGLPADRYQPPVGLDPSYNLPEINRSDTRDTTAQDDPPEPVRSPTEELFEFRREFIENVRRAGSSTRQYNIYVTPQGPIYGVEVPMSNAGGEITLSMLETVALNFVVSMRTTKRRPVASVHPQIMDFIKRYQIDLIHISDEVFLNEGELKEIFDNLTDVIATINARRDLLRIRGVEEEPVVYITPNTKVEFEFVGQVKRIFIKHLDASEKAEIGKVYGREQTKGTVGSSRFVQTLDTSSIRDEVATISAALEAIRKKAGNLSQRESASLDAVQKDIETGRFIDAFLKIQSLQTSAEKLPNKLTNDIENFMDSLLYPDQKKVIEEIETFRSADISKKLGGDIALLDRAVKEVEAGNFGKTIEELTIIRRLIHSEDDADLIAAFDEIERVLLPENRRNLLSEFRDLTNGLPALIGVPYSERQSVIISEAKREIKLGRFSETVANIDALIKTTENKNAQKALQDFKEKLTRSETRLETEVAPLRTADDLPGEFSITDRFYRPVATGALRQEILSLLPTLAVLVSVGETKRRLAANVGNIFTAPRAFADEQGIDIADAYRSILAAYLEGKYEDVNVFREALETFLRVLETSQHEVAKAINTTEKPKVIVKVLSKAQLKEGNVERDLAILLGSQNRESSLKIVLQDVTDKEEADRIKREFIDVIQRGNILSDVVNRITVVGVEQQGSIDAVAKAIYRLGLDNKVATAILAEDERILETLGYRGAKTLRYQVGDDMNPVLAFVISAIALDKEVTNFSVQDLSRVAERLGIDQSALAERLQAAFAAAQRVLAAA